MGRLKREMNIEALQLQRHVVILKEKVTQTTKKARKGKGKSYILKKEEWKGERLEKDVCVWTAFVD